MAGLELLSSVAVSYNSLGGEAQGDQPVRNIDFTVRCTDEQCRSQPATYKIAAEWSGGGITELKTFGFANDECLERVFLAASQRAAKLRQVSGEELGEMHIYRLDTGKHDYELARIPELEEKLAGPSVASHER